ncbi:hypothetical protein OFY05_08535 [Pseudocitrobacter faecalis]|nr:hypothetical protein OFY05_08535 [Pseudocitrobacter faecalis]
MANWYGVIDCRGRCACPAYNGSTPVGLISAAHQAQFGTVAGGASLARPTTDDVP